MRRCSAAALQRTVAGEAGEARERAVATNPYWA
ncbi:hypothetical protein EDF60_2403 [Leucobacter luti]|nr:hypothetical protein [Leucobacter luti]TCK39943.1 hypothetical protein EDF60_2403 [Leucobacter luti]